MTNEQIKLRQQKLAEKMKEKMRKMMMAAEAITLLVITVVLTACADKDDDTEYSPTEVSEQPVELTEDALTVKYDGNFMVYGEMEHGFDLALQRRLQGNMASPTNADCFVFDMAALNQSSLSLDEWKEMVRRCQSGDASYVITQCTFKEFYHFAVLYVFTAIAIELDNYQGDIDPGVQAEIKARVKQRMTSMVRNAYIAGCQADGAMTRGTEVNGQELDWENIDQWPEEKQNAIMFDAYAFCGGNEIYVLNAEASKYMNGEEADQPDNDYEWGQKADVVADWLNRQRKDDAETRAGMADFSRAVTRAGGSTAISDLMNAQTKEFVFDYKYPSLFDTSVASAYSAIKVQYSVYGAYDFSGNVEYYQVRQNITVMNDKLFIDPGDGWWPRSNDGRWTLARGAYMKRIDTKMWLEGSGTKSVVSAAPLNENGSSSGSSSSGGGTTHTEGGSDGYSIGGSVGMSGLNPTFSVSGSYSHTKTYSDATSTTWNTTTNWSTKDLTTVFTQGNDANATVTWKHTGYTPTSGNDAHVSKLKPLLRSTCVTDEQTLWKVQDPSGSYTLRANLNVVAEIYKIAWTGSSYDGNRPTQDNLHDISFDLTAPNRYKVKWNNVIYDYGSVTGDIQLTHYLDEYIEKTYGYNSANFCWAGLFMSTEATADGSDNARAVFQTFKNSITGMKVQLYQKGFRGQLVFGLKRDGSSSLVDKITLDLDNLYSVGETLTEEVNGYELTFKVTKRNEEVELHSVPWNFTGELVIPEQIGEGIHLKVTSLGNNSAVHRKGITAVTIPNTVRTIENGALAELNITEIIIPEGVQTIGTWSFHADNNLTKVFLPSTVTAIQYCAFYECKAITEIHIKATTPPSVASYGLNPAYQSATLYVPTGYKDTYATANYWKGFKNIVEE